MTRIRDMDSDGEFNGEAAALAGRTAHQDSAAMRFDDVFDDAQPNPHALSLAAQFGTATVKSFENPLMCLRCDPVAVVLDPETDDRGRGRMLERRAFCGQRFIRIGEGAGGP